jgi:hypothetical protein
LYCTVIGFVASGITASFFKLATAKPARFALLGEGTLGAASTFLFCAVTGPAIIVDNALFGEMPKGNPFAWMAGAGFVAVLWSACSGVLLVELIYVTTGMV